MGLSTADIKREVEKAYESWDGEFNKKNAKSLAAAYLPSAMLLPPTHQIEAGGPPIEEFWAGLFANGVTGHKLELIDAGGDDKVLFSAARWSANGKDKDGNTTALSGIAVHVFERQADGSLKLRLHIFN
jgi:ketosteroid isomerase-like protein